LAEESRWACPVCGAHRLAMDELPRVGAMGAQPYTDILGMGDPGNRTMPAILCLACGSRWPDADAFWAATRATERSSPEDAGASDHAGSDLEPGAGPSDPAAEAHRPPS
jgi:hypothetical protein